jgi:cytochrome c peroxidase
MQNTGPKRDGRDRVLTVLNFARNGTSHWLLGGVLVCIAIGAISLRSWTAVAARPPEFVAAQPVESNEPIQPIEAIPNLDPRKVALGRKLFGDPRLSHDNQISCATCHILQQGGADGKARSIGIYGAEGIINAPSVLNSGFNFSQFWDGRANTLERQMEGPIESNIEMGSSWPEVLAKLRESPEYTLAFRRIYNDGVQSGHVKDSLAEFERSLSTPNSRFDRYLRHDAQALSTEEQEGYQLFKSLGCASCHQGVGIGGNMYQKMGVVVPYFTNATHIRRADRGRFNVTGDPRDMFMFKVPSLRNVALTAPYFHNGSAATLADAVRTMGKYQLGRPLGDRDVDLIVAFLNTLTGELDGKPL